MTIYNPYGNTWWGSCRMSKSARRDYYKAGLVASISSRQALGLDEVIQKFAIGIAALNELKNTTPASTPAKELCLGKWMDDNGHDSLIVSYRSLFAKVFTVRLNFPGGGYTKMLAVYEGDNLLGSFPLLNRSNDGQVAEIVKILDEVANGKRAGKRTGRSPKGTKANRRAGR
jgi:hypothetical protein